MLLNCVLVSYLFLDLQRKILVWFLFSFFPNLRLVQDLRGGNIRVTGKLIERLYILTVSNQNYTITNAQNKDVISDDWLWYYRLGHLSFPIMKHLNLLMFSWLIEFVKLVFNLTKRNFLFFQALSNLPFAFSCWIWTCEVPINNPHIKDISIFLPLLMISLELHGYIFLNIRMKWLNA